MVKKKGKSKRTTLKDKYKIQRRVVESHRKSRKQAKRDAKNGVIRHDKKKKDPGIPNSWPFKQDLLNEIARAREKAEQTKRDLAERKKQGITNTPTATTLQDLVAQANQSRASYDAKAGNDSDNLHNIHADDAAGMSTPKNAYGQQSRRAYLRELRKVIDASDVLLQVLDARDPVGTRINPTVEDAVLQHYDKRMVLVLNKIDLVPKDAVAGWLAALRRSRPAVAIKCGTNQSQKSEVGRTKGDGALQSSSGVGVEDLLGLLKNYARTQGGGDGKKSKSCITVGIIGYPNVGKSSILNTLKRSRAVGVSPRPGFTTSMQEVVLDRNVRLVDSPGVVFDDHEVDGSDTLLRNCVDADSIDDPIPAVQALLNRCSTESLMMTYSIPAFNKGDVMVFLAMIAKRAGKVLKGGIPDKVMAARTVLRDWNSGKIPYYTPPPSATELLTAAAPAADGATAQIVSGFGDEFDISKMDENVMKELSQNDEMDFVKIEHATAHSKASDKSARAAVKFLTSNDDDGDINENESDIEMEDDDMEEDGTDSEMRKGAFSNASVAHAEDYDFGAM